MSADEDRALGQQALRGRMSGVSWPQIAADALVPEAKAKAAGAAVLRGIARSPEAGPLAAPLALARLDDLERAARSILDEAMTDGSHSLALRAIDRLTAIEERRQGIPQVHPGGVEAAVTGWLKGVPASLAASAHARTAVLLARRMDAGASPGDMTALARELRMTMEALEARIPAGGEDSKVDELRRRREDRERERSAGEAGA